MLQGTKTNDTEAYRFKGKNQQGRQIKILGRKKGKKKLQKGREVLVSRPNCTTPEDKLMA